MVWNPVRVSDTPRHCPALTEHVSGVLVTFGWHTVWLAAHGPSFDFCVTGSNTAQDFTLGDSFSNLGLFVPPPTSGALSCPAHPGDPPASASAQLSTIPIKRRFMPSSPRIGVSRRLLHLCCPVRKQCLRRCSCSVQDIRQILKKA